MSKAKVAGALTVGFVVVVAALLAMDVDERFIPKRFSEVEPGVYRSGQIHPSLIRKTLVENRIGAVIDLQHFEPKTALVAEAEAIAVLDIDAYRFPLNGNGTGDVDRYVAALVKLHELKLAGVPTLVHCAAGSQRTGGVFVVWEVLVQGRSPHAALSNLEQHDWDPARDQVLLDYLNEHLAYIAAQLLKAGVIDSVPEHLPYLAYSE